MYCSESVSTRRCASRNSLHVCGSSTLPVIHFARTCIRSVVRSSRYHRLYRHIAVNTSNLSALHQTWYLRLATVAVFAPLVMFCLDVPAIVLGIDRMNEIDRVTPAT